MKKLVRSNAPACLANLVSGRDGWESADKTQIWEAIDIMQGGFCAYCECKLSRKHIEHFKTRASYTHLTFDWNNLFGSCGDSSQKGGWKRCGIYKDNGAGAYDPEHLIKPDIDNPSDYLLFLTTGYVRPHANLSEEDKFIATETIRVLNLNNDPVLFGSRKSAIIAELKEIEVFYELMSEQTGDDFDELLQDELSRIKSLEFSTALTHAWCYNTKY
ncbi:retron Ec78 anti-phage system effector HNH endonuclease PtuB [Aeromonas dhakensis]|uniref:retron Ec78 anti-phage system effector HNH endonuclease PtuB n=1 Tax=Aeromonas dhakensis TaxID=196024 RepID=UPI0038D07258